MLGKMAVVAVVAALLLTIPCQGARPLPAEQDDFFDLLAIEYPFPTPKVEIDPVAGRLMAACSKIQNLAALAVAASQMHSFNVRPDGSYDLTLPQFDLDLSEAQISLLLDSCMSLFEQYSWMATLEMEASLWCVGGGCPKTSFQTLLRRSSIFCPVGCSAQHDNKHTLVISEVAARAPARMCSVVMELCDFIQNSASGIGSLTGFSRRAASEIRIFLDHAFHTLSFSGQGFPAMHPFVQILQQGGAPLFRHVPVAGLRWDVLLYILSSFSAADRSRGLRVAEIGVEKGMTVTYLMKHDQAIREYYAVDPWHVPGKSKESNKVLESYYDNLESWSRNEPVLQRHGRRAVHILRQSSEEAAGQIDTDYLDVVFIDADHAFESVRRDIQVWKRRLRPGGILAGHDFSLFHPTVSLAVLFECGPMSDDSARFPLQSELDKPILHLSADSVWWVRRL